MAEVAPCYFWIERTAAQRLTELHMAAAHRNLPGPCSHWPELCDFHMDTAEALRICDCILKRKCTLQLWKRPASAMAASKSTMGSMGKL